MGYVPLGITIMKVRWREAYRDFPKEGEDRCFYSICCGCNKKVPGVFTIIKSENEKVMEILCNLCPSCMKSLQAVISPLSILVQTGKDTIREKE